MSPRRLSSTATAAPRAVPGQDVDRPDRGHVLAADQHVPVAEEVDLLGEQLLQVRLHAVLLQAGVDARDRATVSLRISWIDTTSMSAVFAWVTRHTSRMPAACCSSSGSSMATRAGRAHPVEGLVGAAVGVDEEAAVGLQHQQPRGERQVRAQPAGIVDGAVGNDETHRNILSATRRSAPGALAGWGAWPANSSSARTPRRLPHVDGHAEGVLSARFDGTSVVDAVVAARVTNPSWVAVAPGGACGLRGRARRSRTGGSSHSLAIDGRDAARSSGRCRAAARRPRTSWCIRPSRCCWPGTYGSGTFSVFALGDDGSIGERTAFVRARGPGARSRAAGRPARPPAEHRPGDRRRGGGRPRARRGAVVRAVAGWRGRACAPTRPSWSARRVRGTSTSIPTGRHALLVNELDSSIDVLRREGDRFERVQSTHDAARTARPATTPRRPSASRRRGRTVLVSNRGDDTIAVFAFDPAASRVTLVESVPVGGDVAARPGDLAGGRPRARGVPGQRRGHRLRVRRGGALAPPARRVPRPDPGAARVRLGAARADS